jgi:hypothetical protein
MRALSTLTRHEDCGMKTESGTWWAERKGAAP